MYATAGGGNANFINGNGSLALSCGGTVVNDPGINYAPATSAFGPGSTNGMTIPCDGSALSGWNSTSALNGNCLNVTYTFVPGMFGSGMSLSWNMDTDGGPGTSGSAMAGITVTVSWSDNTTSMGTLIPTVPGLTSEVQLF